MGSWQESSNRLIQGILHALSLEGFNGKIEYPKDKIIVVCSPTPYVRITFDITNRSWVLEDTEESPHKKIKEGSKHLKGVACLKGYILNHRGKVRSAKAKEKRDNAYNTATQAQLLTKLKRFDKFYNNGELSISKAAKLAKVEYTTAKSYLNGVLGLKV